MLRFACFFVSRNLDRDKGGEEVLYIYIEVAPSACCCPHLHMQNFAELAQKSLEQKVKELYHRRKAKGIRTAGPVKTFAAP